MSNLALENKISQKRKLTWHLKTRSDKNENENQDHRYPAEALSLNDERFPSTKERMLCCTACHFSARKL